MSLHLHVLNDLQCQKPPLAFCISIIKHPCTALFSWCVSFTLSTYSNQFPFVFLDSVIVWFDPKSEIYFVIRGKERIWKKKKGIGFSTKGSSPDYVFLRTGRARRKLSWDKCLRAFLKFFSWYLIMFLSHLSELLVAFALSALISLPTEVLTFSAALWFRG